MSFKWQAIMKRLGSVAEVWQEHDPAHERLVHQLKLHTEDRPSDFEMVGGDLHRAMSVCLTTIQYDDRTQRVRDHLDVWVPANRGYLKRLGLEPTGSTQGQLSLFGD